MTEREDRWAQWTRPRPDGWADVAYGASLAAIYVALLLATVGDLGYARDEGFYFVAASVYERWLVLLVADPGAALRDVDAYFRVNREHPALVKSLFAVCHALLWEKWRLFGEEGTSYRFGGMLLSALGVGLTYLWGSRVKGRLVGLGAAVSLAMMPRFFHHAHLACFDGPVVGMWTLAAYAYFRASERGGTLRQLAVGLAFGLALDTKHNAWFLPIVCGVHALAALALTAPDARCARAKRSVITMASMALVGPLVFYALWPWIWHDTVARLDAYARFHLEHVFYNMEYLGSNYFEPPMPRSYAFVMTAATVPVVTLVTFVVGLFTMARRERASFGRRGLSPSLSAGMLWMIAMGVQYAAWLRTTTPIFGGTKHWMTAYPFLALFAGMGIVEAARRLRLLAHRVVVDRATRATIGWSRAGLRRFAIGITLAASLVTPAVEALSAHPWALSFYTPLVGGSPGGASLGLNRGFWGYTTGAVAGEIDALTPPGGRVFIHDTAAASWGMLQRDGRLRSDLVAVASPTLADLALYHHEMHMGGVEYQIWVAFETTAPTEIAGIHGVPVIWLYTRDDGRAD
jgi:hypothetical protein